MPFLRPYFWLGREANENKYLFSLWPRAQLCCALGWPKARRAFGASRLLDARLGHSQFCFYFFSTQKMSARRPFSVTAIE